MGTMSKEGRARIVAATQSPAAKKKRAATMKAYYAEKRRQKEEAAGASQGNGGSPVHFNIDDIPGPRPAARKDIHHKGPPLRAVTREQYELALAVVSLINRILK